MWQLTGKMTRKEGGDGAEECDEQEVATDDAEDFGDLNLCAAEECWGVSTSIGQTRASTPMDLPPALIDLNTLDPWARYVGPASTADPWEYLSQRDVGESNYPRKTHRHPSRPPPYAQPLAGPKRGTPDLAQQVKPFVDIIYSSSAAGRDGDAEREGRWGGGGSSSTGQTGARLTNHRLDHGADRLGDATRDHTRHIETDTLSETRSGDSR